MQPDYVRKVLRVLFIENILSFVVDVHVKSELARQLAVLLCLDLN